MKSGTRHSVRWGDSQTRVSTAGGEIRFPEIFRVEAPFPTVYRLTGLAFAELTEAGGGATTDLFLHTGIGSSVFGPYAVRVPTNAMFSFEVSAQALAGFFVVSNCPVVTNYTVSIAVAPVVPWQGIEVKAVQ